VSYLTLIESDSGLIYAVCLRYSFKITIRWRRIGKRGSSLRLLERQMISCSTFNRWKIRELLALPSPIVYVDHIILVTWSFRPYKAHTKTRAVQERYPAGVRLTKDHDEW